MLLADSVALLRIMETPDANLFDRLTVLAEVICGSSSRLTHIPGHSPKLGHNFFLCPIRFIITIIQSFDAIGYSPSVVKGIISKCISMKLEFIQ
jgi:hypothetical protein